MSFQAMSPLARGPALSRNIISSPGPPWHTRHRPSCRAAGSGNNTAPSKEPELTPTQKLKQALWRGLVSVFPYIGGFVGSFVAYLWTRKYIFLTTTWSGYRGAGSFRIHWYCFDDVHNSYSGRRKERQVETGGQGRKKGREICRQALFKQR